ncbi:hypothetical protein [Thalassoroseus pseudoceratinae]|uniref:hypothetical protein n=1 Tax=Thalassoroseus pseudoceratinae TaxID=2713176 RepID=UPI00142284AF|nr:hypothetical protein [Thalassoroseus pseudoceratinae]
MSNDRLENMTLREKYKAADVIVRELIEHVELGFLPKVQGLERLVEPQEASGVYRLQENAATDRTIRDEVGVVLESELFTDDVFDRLRALLESINGDVSEILK